MQASSEGTVGWAVYIKLVCVTTPSPIALIIQAGFTTELNLKVGFCQNHRNSPRFTTEDIYIIMSLLYCVTFCCQVTRAVTLQMLI